MNPQEVVGNRFYISYKDLGSPTVRSDIKIPGFGTVVLDDADVHYGINNPHGGYYIRKSQSLGADFYVVVSRKQPA
jgi:hypothetical protein